PADAPALVRAGIAIGLVAGVYVAVLARLGLTDEDRLVLRRVRQRLRRRLGGPFESVGEESSDGR
ncbi:MAG TPA: hypothetical protein VNJ28_07075, partial [Candidatus Limnocylindrales bacterium]|nr:hypothetical protein [Candidatus Limnocylindrales bacterium]